MVAAFEARDTRLNLQAFLSTLLADELGLFKLTGDPAIWTEPPFLDEQMKVTGLAVIMNRYEQMRSQENIVSAFQALQKFDWKVVIRTYDKTAAGMSVMDSAIDKMRQAFPNHRERPLESVEKVYPQVTYLLDTCRVINTLPPR